jgi:elongation factor Tu
MTTDRFFRMTVEDVFSIAKRGTVVTGKIEAGTLRVGDEVAINGKNGEKRTLVTGIETFRKALNEANAGDTVGVLLKDIAKQHIERGDVLLSPSSDFTWEP